MPAAPPAAAPFGSIAATASAGPLPRPIAGSLARRGRRLDRAADWLGLEILEQTQVVRVGLVGAGYVCAYHARALRSLPFVEIVGLADPDQDRAGKLAEQFQIPKVYSSLEAMAEARPQVIHILTPPALPRPAGLAGDEYGLPCLRREAHGGDRRRL